MTLWSELAYFVTSGRTGRKVILTGRPNLAGLTESAELERERLTELRQVLASRFSPGELRNLCFDLGVDYDDLPGDAKPDKARELIDYLQRRQCLGELARKGPGVRDDVPWQEILGPAPDEANLLQAVLALANTAGGPGYLVFGVLDRQTRKSDDPAHYLLATGQADPAAWECALQSLRDRCDPAPQLAHRTVRHPGASRSLDVVVVSPVTGQPCRAREDDRIYVRRAFETCPVPLETWRQLVGKAGNNRLLLNFGRSISPAQQKQIDDTLGTPVYEWIDVPFGLNDAQPYAPQVLDLVWQVGLTSQEWASLPLLVNVHPFAPATALLLGVIHGLHGHFPQIIRMRRVGDTPEFEVAELPSPQPLRNRAAREGIGWHEE